MRSETTVWKSGIDDRELLRLDRGSGAMQIPICSISVGQLRELQQACEECLELAITPKTFIGLKGAIQ